MNQGILGEYEVSNSTISPTQFYCIRELKDSSNFGMEKCVQKDSR